MRKKSFPKSKLYRLYRLPRILEEGCVLKKVDGWNTQAALHTSVHPPCLIQRAASKLVFFNVSTDVSLTELWSLGPKEEKLWELEEQQIPDSFEWIFWETLSWRLQTSPVYEWITVKLKDGHSVKQIHKNQTKPEQNFQKRMDQMAMDPTSLPHASSPLFEYIFMYFGVLWKWKEWQESIMYNHPASVNSAKWVEEINTWPNS